MRDLGLWLRLIFVVFSSQPKVINSQRESESCNINDLEALKAFFMSLSSSVQGWRNSSRCCKWIGVNCEFSSASAANSSEVPSKRVMRLDLGQTNLRGIVSKSLGNLDQLRFLNLSTNYLSGSLPQELFALQHLEVLDLSNNQFSGLVPAVINLPSIQVLNLANNALEGRQPILSKSRNLSEFIIRRNQFSSIVDAGICNNSSQTRVIDLSSNRFLGNLPIGLGNCQSLKYLFLDSNNLSGSLPDDLFELSSLKLLDIHGNRFSGKLDKRMGNLSGLIDLDVSYNGFSGTIPDVFGGFRNLQNFSAQWNDLEGQIPNSLSSCSTLEHLDLRNNLLNGTINLNCTALPRLRFLDLGNNQLEASILDQLSFCRELNSLNLDGNRLGGQIPESFKNLQSLVYLSVSKNTLKNISRTLQILQECQSLTMLLLGANFKGEEIPYDGILGFSRLKLLSIPNSALSGAIPLWLKECGKLEVLDLSRNHLTGIIPPWVGSFNNLFYLDLSYNSLTGEISKNLTQLIKLIVFDPLIKPNQQLETLPYELLHALPESIDLSNNRLSGQVWPEFGNLARLQILDLSWNNITGTIPPNLSSMLSLEILDLSHNDLSGSIPISFTNLNFLSQFGVAYNRLSGVIPKGGQFSTFTEASFEGNLGLCGEFVLPCSNVPPIATPSNEDEEETSIMGLPFGVGFVPSFLVTVLLCYLSENSVLRWQGRART